MAVGARHRAYVDSLLDDRRTLAALWALIATKSIAHVEPHAAPRPARRRSERAGITTPSAVNVVYLRRPQTEHGGEHDDSGDGPHWSHRWVVRAHPRLQAYGPGRRQRKLIMVGPFIKGPADMPLVVKPTVNALVR